MYVYSYSKYGSICSVVPPCPQGALEMIGCGFCLCFYLFIFFNPSFVGHGVKGLAGAPQCSHLPGSSQSHPVPATGAASLGPKVTIPTVTKDQNESHTDAWLCILLTSTKGFCNITTRVSCGSREDMMYSSLLKS